MHAMLRTTLQLHDYELETIVLPHNLLDLYSGDFNARMDMLFG